MYVLEPKIGRHVTSTNSGAVWRYAPLLRKRGCRNPGNRYVIIRLC